MKYKCTNEVIPQEMREDINTKIEYIVNNDLPEVETGISKDDIFNAYTGLGERKQILSKDSSLRLIS